MRKERTAILVHGFADFNGVSTTDLLRPHLETEGYRVIEFDYGFTGLLGVRFLNDRRSKELTSLVSNERCIAIGHSNGCAIINGATWYGAQFSQCVYLNPALDPDTIVAPQVERVHVYHSPSDLPVKVAKFFYRHPWGEMGAEGFRGQDQRYVNYNVETGFAQSSKGHLGLFKKEIMKFFGPLIVKNLSAVDVQAGAN